MPKVTRTVTARSPEPVTDDDTNQSPDTDDDAIDLGAIEERITASVLESLQGNADGAGDDSATPDADAGTASTEQATTPAAPAPTSDLAAQIEAGVAKVLESRSHAEQHAAMEVPRPARKGLARMIWGA